MEKKLRSALGRRRGNFQHPAQQLVRAIWNEKRGKYNNRLDGGKKSEGRREKVILIKFSQITILVGFVVLGDDVIQAKAFFQHELNQTFHVIDGRIFMSFSIF